MTGALLVALALSGATPPVVLELIACEAIGPAETERLFSLEMRTPLAVEPGTATRARVRCSEDGRVELSVDDAITKKTIARAIALDATPAEARPRLVALALVELIYATWSELMLDPAPESGQAAGASVSEEARHAAIEAVKERGFRLAVALAGESQLGLHNVGTFGGGLRLWGDHAADFGWTVDFSYQRGRSEVAGGHADTESWSAAAGGVWRIPISALVLRTGAGARVGQASITGKAAVEMSFDGRTVSGPFVGPMVFAAAELALPLRLYLFAIIEGAWVLLPVSAIDTSGARIAFDGGLLGAELALGVKL